MLTIDANVFVSASAPAETHHSASLTFIGRIRPTSDTALATQTISGIRLLPRLTLVALTEKQAERAAQIAITCRLRGADAVYVAVAQKHNTTLITWDQELLTRGAAAVPVMTPSDWLAANPTI